MELKKFIATTIREYLNENTDDAYFSKEIADRVPQMYFKLVLCWAVLFLIGIVLVSRPQNV